MSRPTGLWSKVIAQEPGLIAMKCRVAPYERASAERSRFREGGEACFGEGVVVLVSPYLYDAVGASSAGLCRLCHRPSHLSCVFLQHSSRTTNRWHSSGRNRGDFGRLWHLVRSLFSSFFLTASAKVTLLDVWGVQGPFVWSWKMNYEVFSAEYLFSVGVWFMEFVFLVQLQ